MAENRSGFNGLVHDFHAKVFAAQNLTARCVRSPADRRQQADLVAFMQALVESSVLIIDGESDGTVEAAQGGEALLQIGIEVTETRRRGQLDLFSLVPCYLPQDTEINHIH